MAVLRAPHRVLRPRFAPARGWSRGFAPTRARRPVSHSARPLLALLVGGALPPLSRRAVWGSLRSPPFFVGFRFELRAPLQGVCPRCSGPRFSPLSRAPIARHLMTFFVGYRHVLRTPSFASSGFALGCPNPLPREGGSLPPSPSPRVFIMVGARSRALKNHKLF